MDDEIVIEVVIIVVEMFVVGDVFDIGGQWGLFWN